MCFLNHVICPTTGTQQHQQYCAEDSIWQKPQNLRNRQNPPFLKKQIHVLLAMISGSESASIKLVFASSILTALLTRKLVSGLCVCLCACATTAQPVNPSRILRCQLGGSVRQSGLRGTEWCRSDDVMHIPLCTWAAAEDRYTASSPSYVRIPASTGHPEGGESQSCPH